MKYLDYEGLKYYHNKNKEIFQKNKTIQESSKPSILVNTTNDGTFLKANIDNSSIIQDSLGKLSVNINLEGSDQFLSFNDSKLKANIKLKKLNNTFELGENVLEAYQLIGNNNEAISDSDIIKIYKDSSISNVFIGKLGDDVISDGTILYDSGDSETTLNIVYHLEDGSYNMVHLALGRFLEETEFGNGLQVVNHVASIKIANNSAGSEYGPILRASESGLSISQSSFDQRVLEVATPYLENGDSRLNELEQNAISWIYITSEHRLEKELDPDDGNIVTIPEATTTFPGVLSAEDKQYLELLKVTFNLDSTLSDYNNSAIQTTKTQTVINPIGNSSLKYTIDSSEGFLWSNKNNPLQLITPNSYTLYSNNATSLISSKDRLSIDIGDKDNGYGYFTSKESEVNIGSQDYQLIINQERSELEEVLLEINREGVQINDLGGNKLLILNQTQTILKVPQEITDETDENQVVSKKYVDSKCNSSFIETSSSSLLPIGPDFIKLNLPDDSGTAILDFDRTNDIPSNWSAKVLICNVSNNSLSVDFSLFQSIKDLSLNNSNSTVLLTNSYTGYLFYFFKFGQTIYYAQLV